MKNIGLLLVVILSVLSAIQLNAQDVPVVTVNVVSSHSVSSPGSQINLFAEYKLPPTTHLTQNFLELTIEMDDAPSGLSVGLVEITPGMFLEDELIRRDVAILKLPVSIAPDRSPGPLQIKGFASYQICSEGEHFMCFPPKRVPFEVTVNVVTGSNAMNPDALEVERRFASMNSVDETLEKRLSNALAQGSWMALFIVFIAGFLTSLTPCIYPMIPITIGYIGGRSAGQGRWRGFVLSLFYVLGLALIYSSLGVVAAMTKSLFGSITQTPIIVGFVGAIFFAMGLSMLGLFDISLPSGIATRLQGSGPRRGFIGALIMGMVAGLVAAPCAGPVVILLLTYIATTAKILVGFSLMMSFALGMGIIFLLLGTFSGLLTSLPSAGMWMDKIKKTFGILMIAAAIWILNPVLAPPVSGVLWGVFCVMLAAIMGVFEKLDEGAETPAKLRKAIAVVLAVSGLYIVVSLLPIPGKVIPNPQDAMVNDSSLSSQWRQDLDQAILDAKEQNRPMIIDFGAQWCAACKELEHKTFSHPDVKKTLDGMITVKVDCTESTNPSVKAVQEKYDVKGLPTVIYLNPSGEEVSRFVSFLPPVQFIRFIESARNSNPNLSN